MKELGLKGKQRKNGHYHSYKGTIGKVADNLLNRDFKSSKPFEKITTDVTQFNVCNEKVYLSPIMDLFNREIISYSISLSPNLEQIKEMLNSLFQKLPADARPKHSRNRARIHPVGFGLSKAEALPVKVCTQGVQDIGGQTIVKKESKQIAAVVPGRLKPYFYFILWCSTISDLLQQKVESIQCIGDGEHIRQNFTLGTCDKAVVLIF